MHENTTWVALDTAKRQHVAAILVPGLPEPRELTVPNDPRALRRFARQLLRDAPGDVRVCYEAGPCGFAVQRVLLAAAPGLVCDVIAPSLIPLRPGDRIKTDRRDARKLVKLYRAGELTPVDLPSPREEADRDLLRLREGVQENLTRARHRLARFLLRRGCIYTSGRPWSKHHRQWLASLSWSEATDDLVVHHYRLALTQLEEELTTLDAHVEALSQQEPYVTPAGWLRCFHGIDTLTAMTLLTELPHLDRFSHPRALANFLGLVPSEHSSGDRISRGRLTKTGNRHVRRVLIEAAWQYRLPPRLGPALRRRRSGQPPWALRIADQAHHRLARRYRTLVAAGKPRPKVAAAIARELIGFLWAVLQEGRRVSPPTAPRPPRQTRVESRRAVRETPTPTQEVLVS